MTKFLATAKAWCALVGALATALLGTYGADSDTGKVLTAIVALATAVVVFVVPNQPTA